MRFPVPRLTQPPKEIVVQNKTLAARIASLLTGALLLAAGNAAVAGPSEEGGSYPPERAGPYAIGHTTVVITDTSRNVDGSTPVTSSGRPLYLHLWYPTMVATTQHVSR
jgi:hypothetical protein